SSYISGYPGVNSINENGIHTNQPNHYSGKVFSNYKMINGKSSIPSPDGGTMIGNKGHGYARITLLLD
ncbi:MAG: glycine rich domain-containing protein, partial [Bacilli bacterium]|nr:glycine rich domain-containing protein [Bacilli bacterium]